MRRAHDLAAHWRAEADLLRRRGADANAATLESCADELEEALHEHDLEALTLKEAEQESGFSYSALQKMVASDELPNVGEKQRPRVRRGDLPRKAGRLPSKRDTAEPDLAGQILASRY